MPAIRRSQTRAGLSGIRLGTRSQSKHQLSSSSHPYNRKRLTPKQRREEIMADIARICDIDENPSASDDTHSHAHTESSEVEGTSKGKKKRSEPKSKPKERRQATRQSVRMALQRSQAEIEQHDIKPTIQIKKEDEKIITKKNARSLTAPASAGKSLDLKTRGRTDRTDAKRDRKVFEDPDDSSDKRIEIESNTSSPSSNVDSSTSFRPTKQRVVRSSTSNKKVTKRTKKMEEDHLSEDTNNIPPSFSGDEGAERISEDTANSSNAFSSSRAEEKKEPQTHKSVDNSSGSISSQIEVRPLLKPFANPLPSPLPTRNQEGDRQSASNHSRPQSVSRSFDCRSLTSSDFAIFDIVESQISNPQEQSAEEAVSIPTPAQFPEADPFEWANEGSDLSSVRSDHSSVRSDESACGNCAPTSYETHTSHAEEVEEDNNWERRAPSPKDDEIPFHPSGFRRKEEEEDEEGRKVFKVNYEFEERDLAGTPPPYLPEVSEVDDHEGSEVAERRLEVEVEKVDYLNGLDHMEEDVDMEGVTIEEQEDGFKEDDEDKENHPLIFKTSGGKRLISSQHSRPRGALVEWEDSDLPNISILPEGPEEGEAHENVIDENMERIDDHVVKPSVQEIVEDEGILIKVAQAFVDESHEIPSQGSSAWTVTIYQPSALKPEQFGRRRIEELPLEKVDSGPSPIEEYNPPITSPIQDTQVSQDEPAPVDYLPNYPLANNIILSPDSIPNLLSAHTNTQHTPTQNVPIPARDQDIAVFHALSGSNLDPRLAHLSPTDIAYNHTHAKRDTPAEVPIPVPRLVDLSTSFADPDFVSPPNMTTSKRRTASRGRGTGSGRGSGGSARGRGEGRGRARGTGKGEGRSKSITIPSLMVTSPGGSTQPLDHTPPILQPTHMPRYTYWDRPTRIPSSSTSIPTGHHTMYHPHPPKEDTSALHLLADVALTENENTNTYPRGTAGWWETTMGITPQSTKLDILSSVAANIDDLPKFGFNDDGSPRAGPPSILVNKGIVNGNKVSRDGLEPDAGSSTQPINTRPRRQRINSVRFSNYDRVAAVPLEPTRPIIYQPVSAVREEPLPISAVRDEPYPLY